MNYKKLKSQKGLTGIDVVIAITIISVTTVAIMAIYVNLIINSKKATRGSAATRIATSILSNIDYMYYAEVEQELYKNSSSGIITLKGGKIFNTKISSGYTVRIDYSEISNNTDKGNNTAQGAIFNFPLVLDIKVTVSYEASGNTQSITLKTVKERELLDDCNAPDLNDLVVTYGLKSLNNVQPVKWSNSLNSYVKTSASDDWYNYSNREWAKVIVLDSSTKIDASTGAVNLDDENVYVWIPRCGVSTDEDSFAFAYGSSNDAIHKIDMTVNYSDRISFFGIKTYNKSTKKIENEQSVGVNSTYFPKGKTGVWLDITGGNFSYGYGANGASIDSKIFENIKINDTIYGPPNTHLGKTYY